MKKIGWIAALWMVVWIAQPLAAQQTKELVILQTSDTHSRIEPVSPQAADRNAGLGA